MQQELVWDDDLWEDVWERLLGPTERHAIAVDVWRRRLPTEPLDARIAAELARRWRRRALNLAVVYALWTLFWGMIAVWDWRQDNTLESWLCPVNTLIGVMAIAACFAFRARIRDVARR